MTGDGLIAIPTLMPLCGSFDCRCVVCARCGQHTGNSSQGHWWSVCKVQAERVAAALAYGETLSAAEFLRRANRGHHFCCPGGCELEP